MTKRVLVLGATGMLGASLFRYFSALGEYETYGVARQIEKAKIINSDCTNEIIISNDLSDANNARIILSQLQPDYVFNCIGIIKQSNVCSNHINTIEMNSLLPHVYASICTEIGAKLVHFSTDCVFSGIKGHYSENDVADSDDLYGRSKRLGEVNYDNHLTLRTSIIGHELTSSLSLIDWFLSTSSEVKGYSNAIFSGLPTVYLAEVLHKFILPKDLSGLYHLSVNAIDKKRLLELVNYVYGSNKDIIDFPDFEIDRSLNSSLLRAATNFVPLPWDKLIEKMHDEYKKYHI
ncbi:MAG: SDR family oxidoreductase [Leclercia sp.]